MTCRSGQRGPAPFIAAVGFAAIAAAHGCTATACLTAAALEAAPPVDVAGAPGLLVRMGRALLLSAARARCAEAPAAAP